MAAPRFQRAHLQLFVMSTLFPAEYRERVSETYEFGRRTLQQELFIEARVPAAALEDASGSRIDYLYFPVLMPRKGKFQDELAVSSPSGDNVLLLSYREYLVLAVRAARMLVAHSVQSASHFDVPQIGRKLSEQSVEFIASRRIDVGESRDRISTSLGNCFPEDVQMAEDSSVRVARTTLVKFVDLLHRNYCIVARVKPDADGRFSLTVRQTLIPDIHLVSLRSRIGLMLGARPYNLRFSLQNAITTTSFHLKVNGPEEFFVERQKMPAWERVAQRDETRATVGPPHFRFRSRLGQSYSHFYCRHVGPKNLQVADLRDANPVELELGFSERPPGSALPAAASALATFILVWVTAIMATKTGIATSVAPGWFLAFPALVASWLGIQAPTGRLPEGTLAARFSLLMTILICLSATAYYLVRQSLANTNDLRQWLLPPGWSVLFVSDYAYIGLLLMSMLNAGWILYKYLSRAAFYEYLSTRNRGSGPSQRF